MQVASGDFPMVQLRELAIGDTCYDPSNGNGAQRISDQPDTVPSNVAIVILNTGILYSNYDGSYMVRKVPYKAVVDA